jgi:hypothetical protein
MYVRRGFGDSSSSLVTSIAAAIQQMEGWFPGSVSYRNNNPGNLRSGPGMIGTDANGYAIFPDVATGEAALDAQIQTNIDRGLNLQQFFAGGNGYAGYAPSADNNNPTNYANFVASQVGIDTSTPLSQLQSGGTAVAPAVSDSDDSIDLSSVSDDGGLSVPLVVGLAALGIGVLWLAFGK